MNTDLSYTFRWHVRSVEFNRMLPLSTTFGNGDISRHQIVIYTYEPETDRERGVIVISGRVEDPANWVRVNGVSWGGVDHIGTPQQLYKVSLIEVTPCGPSHHSVRIEMSSGDIIESTLINMDFGCEGIGPNEEFTLTSTRDIQSHEDYHARDGVVLFSALDLL
ncbi:MAG: hypothetical protein CMF22_11425 [Idiomarinaceae bacterium]|nr:hypothetical protein [Idiomarinaceae bacterium]